MHIILSRKGFDSSYGGSPSIILPNNKMISFPIPVEAPEIGTASSDIKFENINLTLEEIFQKRGINNKIHIKKTIKNSTDFSYHLDPEIQNITALRNNKYGTLGQRDAALGHILNKLNKAKALMKSDFERATGGTSFPVDILFLFFGRFIKVDGKWATTGDQFHSVWGYLHATKLFRISTSNNSISQGYEQLKDHPHYKNAQNYASLNGIFVGEKYGTLNFTDNLLLTDTKKGSCISDWNIKPLGFINSMTYNAKAMATAKALGNSSFRVAAKGQEFVVTDFDKTKMDDWLKKVKIDI